MPPDAFTFETSGQVIMMTVIGGLETLVGPLVGAAVWLYLRDFLQGELGLGASWKLVLGLVFVLLMSFLDAESSAASPTSTRVSPTVERPPANRPRRRICRRISSAPRPGRRLRGRRHSPADPFRHIPDRFW